MLIIKALGLGSALMLLASCAGYLTNYHTPCVQGHVCECVQYTTVNRSWLDCRDYGGVKQRLTIFRSVAGTRSQSQSHPGFNWLS